jgi:hypothetical protein
MEKSNKESAIEKLRYHTFDIIFLSMVAVLSFCLIKNKQESNKLVKTDIKYEIKSVTDVKQIHMIDTLNTKTR